MRSHIISILQNIFRNTLEYVEGVLFSLLISVIVLGVFFRYVLNNPLSWSEELARYLLVWMTLFGATIAAKRKVHLKVDFGLFSFLPKRLVRQGRIFMSMFIIVFLIVMTYKGMQLCSFVKDLRSPALNIPMGYVWAVVPLTGFLMFVFFSLSTLSDIWNTFRR